MSRAPRLRRLPRFSWILLTAACLAATAFATRPVTDPSPWLHLKVGQFLLDGHRFTLPDAFGPYVTKTYEPTQWLPSIAGALLYDQFGLSAIAWTRTAGIACFALALVLATRLAARPPIALGAAALGLAAALPSLTERPQTLGFVLLVVSISAWWLSAHDGRPRWWLIPLTWLTACVHGVWSLGVGLGAAIVVGLVAERAFTSLHRRRLLMVLGGSVVAAGLTPLGPRLLLSPFAVGGNARQFVSEWMASSIRMPAVALTMVVLAVVFGLWAGRGERPPLWKLVLWVAAIVLVLMMRRTVPVGAIVAAMLLADALESLALRRTMNGAWAPSAGSPTRRAEAAALVAATALALLVSVPLAGQRAQQPHGVPTKLAASLDAIPAGTHVISDGDMSGWLMFEAPQLRPVFDIRVEAYSPEHIRGFIAALGAEPGWTAYLQRTQARAALLKADAPLASALADQWHWRVAQTDGRYVLMEAP